MSHTLETRRPMPGIVTIYHLEMSAREAVRAKPVPNASENALALRRMSPADWRVNRHWYCRLGRDWEWTDRHPWTEKVWTAYAHRDELETWIGHAGRREAGYYELEIQPDGAAQIMSFGLLPAFHGWGLGKALLEAAIARAVEVGAERIHLNTCSKDHPAALANYLARGFHIYRKDERPSPAPPVRLPS